MLIFFDGFVHQFYILEQACDFLHSRTNCLDVVVLEPKTMGGRAHGHELRPTVEADASNVGKVMTLDVAGYVEHFKTKGLATFLAVFNLLALVELGQVRDGVFEVARNLLQRSIKFVHILGVEVVECSRAAVGFARETLMQPYARPLWAARFSYALHRQKFKECVETFADRNLCHSVLACVRFAGAKVRIYFELAKKIIKILHTY